MTIKAVIFDIGGVVVGSPIEGANVYCADHGLPYNYINAAITATGKDGAFQKLERGEIELEQFYDEFGKGLSDVDMANEAYKRYCSKTGTKCPTLPEKLDIDGRELWTTMMIQALTIDPVVYNAIIKLRRSKKVKVAALTNNFTPTAGSSTASKQGSSRQAGAGPDGLPSYEDVQEAIMEEARQNPAATGSAGGSVRHLFDYFIESAVEGLRKPDPRFFQLALDRIDVKGEEAAFLDDIGLNLISARKLGIHTIRVHPNRSREAIQELEKLVGIALIESESAKL